MSYKNYKGFFAYELIRSGESHPFEILRRFQTPHNHIIFVLVVSQKNVIFNFFPAHNFEEYFPLFLSLSSRTSVHLGMSGVPFMCFPRLQRSELGDRNPRPHDIRPIFGGKSRGKKFPISWIWISPEKLGKTRERASIHPKSKFFLQTQNFVFWKFRLSSELSLREKVMVA